MSSYKILRTALRARATPHLTSTTSTTVRLAASRQVHQSSALRAPYKDDMDRESLKPKSHEYTQGGTDEDVATKQDAAFNPNKTDPDTEKKAAAEESNGNPLEESPANKDFAEASRGKEEDKRTGGQKKKASGGGNAPKNSKLA
ncbi:uncharacterized protein F4807DRAFT_30226 [Annulohypoxylon truncatum]|uniref:uncharacterized protein n=1 Tax=Annulohypoxylon truncatum TaxID=327061 RepID=UPI00200848E8|nr:uncharacterized protein F4807DRAFT_30226 [Annulohypoxylon truncatum]KAI1211262.1 hypothetical protein F4807DRAFT_30226 [Annulohypoxylon truncatum]